MTFIPFDIRSLLGASPRRTTAPRRWALTAWAAKPTHKAFTPSSDLRWSRLTRHAAAWVSDAAAAPHVRIAPVSSRIQEAA